MTKEQLEARVVEVEKFAAEVEHKYYALKRENEELSKKLENALRNYHFHELSLNEKHGIILGMNTVLDRFHPLPLTGSHVCEEHHTTPNLTLE